MTNCAGYGRPSQFRQSSIFREDPHKLSAHTDVHYRDGKYVLLDVKSLGLKWGDVKESVETLQQLVELVNFLVRNASFAWDILDEQLQDAVVGFWGESE